MIVIKIVFSLTLSYYTHFCHLHIKPILKKQKWFFYLGTKLEHFKCITNA